MNKKTIKFDDTEIEEYKFHHHESLTSINDIDINKIVVSNKLLFGKQDFKCFIIYKHARKLELSAYSVMSIQKRDFDKTKYM